MSRSFQQPVTSASQYLMLFNNKIKQQPPNRRGVGEGGRAGGGVVGGIDYKRKHGALKPFPEGFALPHAGKQRVALGLLMGVGC